MTKKVLVLLAISLSIIGLVFFPVADDSLLATEKEDLKIEIDMKGKEFIDLSWSDIGANYYVLRSGKDVLYEGEKTSFKHKDLEAASFVEYSLFAYDEQDKLLDAYELTTYTQFEDESVINYSIGKSDSEVLLDWSDVPNAIKYEVYLDDKVLSETKSSHFTHDLDNKQSGIYKVLVYLPNTDELPKAEIMLDGYYIPESEDIVEGGKEISLKYEYDFKSLFFETNLLNDKSGTHREEIDKELSASNSIMATTTVQVRIRTFIADSCYSDWVPGSGDGDGRGPSATSGSHRTQMDIYARFGDTKNVTFSQDAGETIAYTYNGCDPEDEFDRDTPGMNESVTYTHYGSYTKINVDHSVGTPVFANVLPNIDYDFDLTVYQGGLTVISGSHDGFPDYEVYKRVGYGSWSRLYYWDASANGQSIYSLSSPMEIEI